MLNKAAGRARFLHQGPAGFGNLAAFHVTFEFTAWCSAALEVLTLLGFHSSALGQVWWQRQHDGFGDDFTRLPLAFQDQRCMECREWTTAAVSQRKVDPL